MLYDSSLWIEDIDKTITFLPELNRLEGTSVFITGANGLICSAIVDVLLRYNDTHINKVKIFTAGRSEQRMYNRFGQHMEEMSFVEYDAAKKNRMDFKADYVIHGASNASPNMIASEPVETMVSNFLGMKELLDYAKKNKSKRVLFISSSEVYGKKESDGAFREDQYGFVDLLKARSSYPIGKRAAETLCASYSEEYGIDYSIIRPGHIYGPTASRRDNRVSSAWAYDVAEGKDIVMKSDGAQIRSYCYCLDCASAIIKVLLCGENGTAYNISNPDSIISIRELAEIMANYGKSRLVMEVPSEAEKKAFNPMNNSSLDSRRLIDLGWKGMFDAKTGIEHTVQILKEGGLC